MIYARAIAVMTTPRITACREDQSDNKCKKIVKDVCDASPLDTLCADDNRYKKRP